MVEPRARAAKAPRDVIDLCDSEDESTQPLTIDLCDSDDDADAEQPSAPIDDEALARSLQRKFDAEAARAAPVDFKALDAARRARAAARPKGAAPSDDDDLLYSQRESLRDSAAASAGRLRLKVVSVEHNEHSRPRQPLYERFVAAWRRVPNKTMRLVYHATPERNIRSILRQGLDSRKRGAQHGQVGGAGEYFGKDVRTSAPYGHGSRKMLVFCILVDKSGITSEDRGHRGEIVVNKKDHQLPLAVVVFDRMPFNAVTAVLPGNMQLPGNLQQMLAGLGGGANTMLAGLGGAAAIPFAGPGRRLGGS